MTAIVVTMGPSTDSPESIRRAAELGATAFRFPSSKFAPEILAKKAIQVSEIVRASGVAVELLLDLPGSKTRFTNDDGFALAGLDVVRINYDATPGRRDASPPELGLTGSDVSGQIEAGDTLIVGDGEDALRIETVAADHCLARPLTTGELGRRRGVVIKGKLQPHETFTDRDLAALEMVHDTVFDAVILSFVEAPEAVDRARSTIRARSDRPAPRVVAKVETKRGVDATGAIAERADAILLGRGDLLLEVGEADFYSDQKRVIKSTAAAGKPIIVGTHLLPSLSANWLPNRSELVHLCHLLDKGVDALMLSTETTIGRNPARTIELIAEMRERYETCPNRAIFAGAAAS